MICVFIAALIEYAAESCFKKLGLLTLMSKPGRGHPSLQPFHPPQSFKKREKTEKKREKTTIRTYDQGRAFKTVRNSTFFALYLVFVLETTM